MTTPLNDENVVKMYKESAVEIPSKETDDAILNYAKTNHSTVLKPHYIANWKPIFGLVATIAFVTLLTPWKWVEKPNLMHEEIHLESTPYEQYGDALEAHIEAAPAFSETAPAATKMNEEKEFKKQERMLKSTPELNTQFNPFFQVEKLVLEGKRTKAREELKRLLDESPNLEATLPEHLVELLQNE
ncbi:hypothetical protein HC752_15675 [Vibrio sp. S9_S30]|uniref:hypothetical protein n=1 Tax=Vibrio sp. S9_S30 TaxID=2720226 RepID=UPI001680BE75|nr:hypothetical protein [Vibrio sp. S9_S30]MBD1558376.1 hypothetical protein [Vibrio sp. S9_S30]